MLGGSPGHVRRPGVGALLSHSRRHHLAASIHHRTPPKKPPGDSSPACGDVPAFEAFPLRPQTLGGRSARAHANCCHTVCEHCRWRFYTADFCSMVARPRGHGRELLTGPSPALRPHVQSSPPSSMRLWGRILNTLLAPKSLSQGVLKREIQIMILSRPQTPPSDVIQVEVKHFKML